MYIGDYLGRREIYSPDKLAIVDAGKEPEWRLTYRQMNARANRLANWLRDAAGLGHGDRVAILAADGVEHLDCFFACGKLGAIHTTLNWRLHWREVLGIVENTRPAILIYSEDYKDVVAEVKAAVDNTPYAIGHYLHLEGGGIAGSLDYRITVSQAPDTPVADESLDKEDTAALIFTGGTTGLPKAAMVSHRMIGWNTLNTVVHDITHDDVYLNVFPMFHTGGLFVYTLPQVIFGGTTILLRRFDPARVLELIERERVTVFAGVPTMYQMMTQAPNWASADLGSLRFCTSGGAPLPVPLVEQYTREKGVRFKQGFGMTEFGPGIFALAPEDAVRKAGSIGRPNFFVDARIVDDDNHPLGPGEVGELVLKGPSYCSGYFDNPEATAAAVDEEGWFHTGDLAYHDEEWYFYIVDRKKDMFISGGENVYPAEIEAVLYKHPAVQMCAVVGLPDPKWGQVGQACVVLKAGAGATEEELMAFMQGHLARYKVPRRVRFMAELPISSAGKILKRELREQLMEKQEEVNMSSIPTLDGIRSEIVQTERLKMHVLTAGPEDGVPVVFVHGNGSASTFWEETMLALPEGYRAIAPDMRAYGDTEPLPVDATLGLDDMVWDLRSLIEAMGIGPRGAGKPIKYHIVGHSMGGGIVMKYTLAHADDLLSITLVDSMSPYGYSGSKDVEGTPCHVDGAPAGAGSVNPDFVRLMMEKDRGTENPVSPRNVLRQFYVKPPFIAEREEALLSSMLSLRIGPDWYPGDAGPSPHWPGAAPGEKGIVNAFSRKYFDASGIADVEPKPPILWIRGADDLIVANNALWDIAALGAMGAVPGWPGPEDCPPQPMLDQIRAVLDRYQANGGSYREEVIEDAGHSPYIEKPEAFNAVFHAFLAEA